MKNDSTKHVEAVLSLAEKKDQLDQILFDVIALVERLGYQSVVTGRDEQEKRKIVITNQFQYIGSAELNKYFSRLLAKKDLWLFEPTCFKVFADQLKSAIDEMVCIRLTVAIPLDFKYIKKLAEKIAKKVNKKVLVDVTVDESIVAGAIIHKDNYILDFSVKSKLQHLAKEWKKTILEAELND